MYSSKLCYFFTGEVLGALCEKCGAAVYAANKERVICGVRDNLERQFLGESLNSSGSSSDTEQLVEKFIPGGSQGKVTIAMGDFFCNKNLFEQKNKLNAFIKLKVSG